MTHATSAEIHDHAYGFRSSPHVAQCAECRREAEQVAAERSAIRNALAEDPVSPPAALLRPLRLRRGSLSPAGVIAAAALLAALAWLLFRPSTQTLLPADGGPRRPQEDTDRLIGELKSPSEVRREIAALALRAYGRSVVEKLEKAKADPALLEACRGVTPEVRAIQEKLESTKVDLAFENTKASDILPFIRDFYGLNIAADDTATPKLAKEISIRVQRLTVKEALKLILSKTGLDFRITEDQVVLITSPESPPPVGRAPIRVPGGTLLAAKEIARLDSDRPAERDQAVAALRSLGFAAEPLLWNALESANPETRLRAADCLRALYSPAHRVHADPLEERLRTTRITVDELQVPLTKLVDSLSKKTGVGFLFDPLGVPTPALEMVSFRAKDVSVEGALLLMLRPRNLEHVVVGDLVVLTKPERILRSPEPPFWTTPGEARRMEALLRDLGSNDPARQERAESQLVEVGQPALGPLTQASHAFDGAAAGRCRAACVKIARRSGAWFVDEPSGVDRQTLTLTQRNLLARTLTMKPGTQTLKDILASSGVKAVFKVAEGMTPEGSFPEAHLGSFLKAFLRPSGLDFYLDGETVVVDGSTHVRAAVEK